MKYNGLFDNANPIPSVKKLIRAPGNRDFSKTTFYRGVAGVLSLKAYFYGIVGTGFTLYDGDYEKGAVSLLLFPIGYLTAYISNNYEPEKHGLNLFGSSKK